MKFLRRHAMPAALIAFGLVMLLVMSHLFSNQQVGINPTEFILKGFAKVFYLGVAWLLTHIFVKYFFPTVYGYCHRKGEAPTSEFTDAWNQFAVDRVYDPRITTAINVHIGIFAAVWNLLALAF